METPARDSERLARVFEQPLLLGQADCGKSGVELLATVLFGSIPDNHCNLKAAIQTSGYVLQKAAYFEL